MKAPFPYFGGKARIAHRVWLALGDPAHYIEPFFGSGAVLLARPDWTPDKTETVNDKDSHLCNVWRALQFAPDETARWCDWPVNHDDLRARKACLIANEARLRVGLVADPEWCDPKLAGYWIWSASCWIGSGLTCPQAIPALGSKGMGVNAGQIPHLGDKGMGVNAGQIPHLGNKGKGVNAGKSIASHPDPRDPYNGRLWTWFRELSERLRYVRVVCGDWMQVLGGDWQDNNWPTVGMFFDPPYGVEDRDTAVYAHDGTGIAAEVMEWARERGARPNYRIVLAGYEEYQALVDDAGWTLEEWAAQGGYSNVAGKNGQSQGQQNRHRERLYFSPACQSMAPPLLGLMAGKDEG